MARLGSDGHAGVRAVKLLREAAKQAALVLHRDYLAVEVARGHARELVRELVAPDQALRKEASAMLVADGHAVAGPVTVLVAMVAREEGEPLAEQRRLTLALAVDGGLPPPRADWP
ncbi:hypothetical protein [Streptomyces niveus]|uniref:hypothetical protein n=1 Tax=Streptomyces niveus TaxID=193462 RepID=UPI00367B3679